MEIVTVHAARKSARKQCLANRNEFHRDRRVKLPSAVIISIPDSVFREIVWLKYQFRKSENGNKKEC